MKPVNLSTLLIVLLPGLVLAAGCGGGATKSSIRKASKSGDADYLRAVCKGEKTARSEEDKEFACKKLEKNFEGPKRALMADCSSLVKAYEETSKPNHAYVHKMARKFADCGFYKELFEKVVHYGNMQEGMFILIDLDKAGLPVEQNWKKYLENNQGKNFFAVENEKHVQYGLYHIVKWLLDKSILDHCAAVALASTGASDMARVSVLPYLQEAACAEGLPVMRSLLLAKSWNHRATACGILGEVGDPASLAKVKTLAETDGYYEISEEKSGDRIVAVKRWPVREICKAASGQIMLRMSP